MSEPVSPPDEGELEPVRIPDPHLEETGASVRKLMEQSARQTSGSTTSPPSPHRTAPHTGASPFAAFGMPGLGGPLPAAPAEPRPILELEGEEYEDELDALSDWVDDFLLPAYGAEVTAAPWCLRWQEHSDVVAWLHALWLAYQQHKNPEVGLSGLLVWHQDFLTRTMVAVRGPGGPLSACMTSPDRPAHRLLPVPPPSARTEKANASDASVPGEPTS
ncbi:DUF4913 domain-containing protein [Streptomyces prasinus]|uniref:DUF4913 domain-containing protein n=1 Tax=Streptomyces prasinus TaxID=67345 RepID=UPI0037D28853